MAFKTFTLDDQYEIKIYKRKGARSLRLSVTSTGTVRLTIPTWTPYSAGLQFARSRLVWIAAQQRPSDSHKNGQAVGKAHRLSLISSPVAKKVTSRVIAGSVVVKYPATYTPEDEHVQNVIRSASVRALRSQAENLLPQRLSTLATKNNFTYKDVSIKQLKSRWGSCDQHGHIVLNLFLMQLPWELIDYVLLHELTHTQHLHHGPDFWAKMAQLVPNVPSARKAMRTHQPVLSSS